MNKKNQAQNSDKKRKLKEISNSKIQDEEILFGSPSQDNVRNYNYDEEEDYERDFDRDEDQPNPSDEEEGEDILDGMEDDYKAKPELDQYEAEGLDEEEQVELDPHLRRKVDQELNQQDRIVQREKKLNQRRLPAALESEELNDEFNQEESTNQNVIRQERIQMRLAQNINEDRDENMKDALDYEDVRGKLSIWLMREEVLRWIKNQFSSFLRHFKDDNGHSVYENRINDMCANNKQSLEVNFSHITLKNPTLAIWLAEEPSQIFPILNQVGYELTLELFPEYYQIHKEMYVRIIELPVEDRIRDLRKVHLNALIKIKGVVTKRSCVYPELNKMYFKCQCGDLKGPILHNNAREPRQYLGQCVMCQSNGPYTLDESKTLYRNYQKITIQETPGSVPPGRVPRQKEIYLVNDQVDSARPGDEVEITGIYINQFDLIQNARYGFPVFNTIIEANYVRRFGDEQVIEITDEDKDDIKTLAKSPNIGQKIINSIAPSIYGHNYVKKALALAMFGGEPKDISGKHRIRGDINVLLLGDPGTAKSQFLKYVEQIYHRVVYTTGKGASAVGLTAGVHRDPMSGDWVLEGGALVLADKGICLIDEFDKMNDQDRTSIHEAMEQQSISISKAGIVTSLQARCSVIAAANPIKGVYNTALSFIDNVDLTDPILSRFDILSVIKDEVNEEHDDALATFVINSHMKSHPDIIRDLKIAKKPEDMITEQDEKRLKDAHNYIQTTLLEDKRLQKINLQEDIIDQEQLKKYIIYAKKYVHPKLNEIDREKVINFYADIRRESSMVQGIPIAVRHIESVLRMAEAHAKIHLREYVRSDDIDVAIEMLLESFLQSQKLSVARQLAKRFEKYKTRKSDPDQLLISILVKMINDRAIYEKYIRGLDESERIHIMLPQESFYHESRDIANHNITHFFKSSTFNKDYKIEGRHIITRNKI
eukprot:403359496